MDALPECRDITEPTNGGEHDILFEEPYTAYVRLQGTTDMLFHGWNCEAIEEKAQAAKNSAAKKTDNVESYVFRDDKGHLCIPGEYVRGAIIAAARYRQDPRSPRKSAQDLFRAGVTSLTTLSTLGIKNWDYEDKRRVMVQRQGINRTRPAIRTGWKAAFELQINTPEYISDNFLRDVLALAGRLIGVGDFRPTFGRFGIIHFEII